MVYNNYVHMKLKKQIIIINEWCVELHKSEVYAHEHSL